MILGVLGGSGLYDIDGLVDARAEEVQTPFGSPSAPVVSGRVGDARLLFLPRHGLGHRFSPSEINYRANVFALKALGATRVLSVSAVGSLREGLPPGDLVLCDQFIDKTWGRGTTFFGAGAVGHVSFAEPTCPAFGAAVAASAGAAGFPEAPAGARLARAAAGGPKRLHRGGTYVCMEGPQFSTRAESELHRSWGADVIGMTAATEAKLCREAELCFAALALVTDWDGWHEEEAAVTAAAVIEVLRQNVAGAKEIVRRLPAHARAVAACGCAGAAAHAIITAPEAISAEARQRLRALYGRDL
jgi:5'-methylthioadenosine phosphorylase